MNYLGILALMTTLLALRTAATGQCRLDQMRLRSADLPLYAPFAHQAAIQGKVELTFDVHGDLPSSPTSPTNIKVVSGSAILGEGAKLELATWKLYIPGEKLHEHNCRTTFVYSLSDKRVGGAMDIAVRFHGLGTVEIHTDRFEIEEDQSARTGN